MTYYSTLNQGFVVHKADGTIRAFKPSKKELFFFVFINDIAYVFNNTVDSNKSKYTIKDYSNTVHAFSLQDIIGRPSTLYYIKCRR